MLSVTWELKRGRVYLHQNEIHMLDAYNPTDKGADHFLRLKVLDYIFLLHLFIFTPIRSLASRRSVHFWEAVVCKIMRDESVRP